MVTEEDEFVIGTCERCGKTDVPVVADGYSVAFLCGECIKVVHGIHD